MQSGIHPAYGPVVFRDGAAGFAFPARSTATGEVAAEREDGRVHPVTDAEVSSASRPFSTGTARALDTAGRVERFARGHGERYDRPGGPGRSGHPVRSGAHHGSDAERGAGR